MKPNELTLEQAIERVEKEISIQEPMQDGLAELQGFSPTPTDAGPNSFSDLRLIIESAKTQNTIMEQDKNFKGVTIEGFEIPTEMTEKLILDTFNMLKELQYWRSTTGKDIVTEAYEAEKARAEDAEYKVGSTH